MTTRITVLNKILKDIKNNKYQKMFKLIADSDYNKGHDIDDTDIYSNVMDFLELLIIDIED